MKKPAQHNKSVRFFYITGAIIVFTLLVIFLVELLTGYQFYLYGFWKEWVFRLLVFMLLLGLAVLPLGMKRIVKIWLSLGIIVAGVGITLLIPWIAMRRVEYVHQKEYSHTIIRVYLMQEPYSHDLQEKIPLFYDRLG